MGFFFPSCFTVYFINLRNSSVCEWCCWFLRLRRASGNTGCSLWLNCCARLSVLDLDHPGYCTDMGSRLCLLVCQACVEKAFTEMMLSVLGHVLAKLCISACWWYQEVVPVLPSYQVSWSTPFKKKNKPQKTPKPVIKHISGYFTVG